MENMKLIQEMILLSIKKKEIMGKILDVTKRQKEFIELGKIETVEKHIKLKDRYISEVDYLDIKFFAIANKLKENLNINSLEEIDGVKYPQVKKMKEIVKEILEITVETKTLDDENILSLKEDKNNLSEKLKSIRQGKKISGAYNAPNIQVGSMFFDKKK